MGSARQVGALSRAARRCGRLLASQFSRLGVTALGFLRRIQLSRMSVDTVDASSPIPRPPYLLFTFGHRRPFPSRPSLLFARADVSDLVLRLGIRG